MLILDTSQIQARKPNPQVREISRLTWDSASIPQNAIPFTENGHPYVLEFDEYTAGTLNPPAQPGRRRRRRGSSTSPTRPRRAWWPTCACRSTSRPTTTPPATTRARSARPRATRRTTATSRRASTRRSWPARSSPRACGCSTSATCCTRKEIGYFVAPTTPNTETGYTESDYAMSQPDVRRRPPRDLVHGRRHRLLRGQRGRRRVARRGADVDRAARRRGRLAGRQLGRIRLGMTRAGARRALSQREAPTSTPSARAGVRVLYGGPKQLVGPAGPQAPRAARPGGGGLSSSRVTPSTVSGPAPLAAAGATAPGPRRPGRGRHLVCRRQRADCRHPRGPARRGRRRRHRRPALTRGSRRRPGCGGSSAVGLPARARAWADLHKYPRRPGRAILGALS